MSHSNPCTCGHCASVATPLLAPYSFVFTLQIRWSKDLTSPHRFTIPAHDIGHTCVEITDVEEFGGTASFEFQEGRWVCQSDEPFNGHEDCVEPVVAFLNKHLQGPFQ